MLFEKLVEQHGVDLLVPNGLRLTLTITDDQVGVYFFYFLCNESKLGDTLGIDILFITKAHRLKRQNSSAGFAHWLYILLKSRRGHGRSELTTRIYKDGGPTRSRCSADSRNERGSDIRIADSDGVALICYAEDIVTDIDIIIAKGQAAASQIAQGGVVATDVVEERHIATGCIVVTGILIKRPIADGCVVVAAGVAAERLITKSVVGHSICVSRQRKTTYGIVENAGHIRSERPSTDGIVAGAIGVGKEGKCSSGRVQECASGET